MAWNDVVVDGLTVDFAADHNEEVYQIRERLTGQVGATPSTIVFINGAGTGATGTDYIITATAADIKMNGAQAVGTLHKVPPADHIHPSDTSRLSTATAAIPKRTLFLSMAGGWASTTYADAGYVISETNAGATATGFNIKGTLFDAKRAGEDQTHEFSSPMPENWNGSTLSAIPFVVPKSPPTAGNYLIFGLQGAVVYATDSTGDLISSLTYGTSASSRFTLAADSNGRLLKGTSCTVTLSGATPVGGSWVQWKTRRYGEDEYAYGATLLGWLITYTTDTYSDE